MQQLIGYCFGAIIFMTTILVAWVLLAIAKEFKTVGAVQGVHNIMREDDVLIKYEPKSDSYIIAKADRQIRVSSETIKALIDTVEGQ